MLAVRDAVGGVDMEWTEENFPKMVREFEERCKKIYPFVEQRGKLWFKYKETRYFKFVILDNADSIYVIMADAYMLDDGTLVSPDDSDGFFMVDYNGADEMFQALMNEIDRWKNLEDDD
jgi:hypothetical protein